MAPRVRRAALPATLVLLAFAWAGDARAQNAVADTAYADTVGTGAGHVHVTTADDSLTSAGTVRLRRGLLADTTSAHRRGPAGQPVGWDQPRWVMLRSLVFPGWGQFHNRAYGKAAALFAVEGYLIGRIVADESRLGRLQRDIDRDQLAHDDAASQRDVTAYNGLLDASVSRGWLLGGVAAYAMLDAYVDAYFVDFDVQFKQDPALQGKPPESRVRLGLRTRF